LLTDEWYTVTEEMKVPLYSIAASQLGTDPSNLQPRLLDALEIAAAWNAGSSSTRQMSSLRSDLSKAYRETS
jgi:hypothetical protein